MKSLILLFFALTATQANAGGLERIATPILDSAVERHYDMGRHGADSGGIASIKVYKNTRHLKTFGIVKEAMKQDHVAYITCPEEFGEGVTNACVRLVLEHSADVRPNLEISYLAEWIEYLTEWDFDMQWNEDLGVIEMALDELVGQDYKSYSYGYDGIADTWTTILISKDKKTVVAVTSDYGA